MTSFVTVREAAQLTGKSPSSIRRVIHPIVRDDKHPDRKHIEPNVEEATRLRLKGERFAWRLSEELLRREIPVESVLERSHSAPSKSSTGESDLLVMLRRELDIKNHQITQQMELIAKQAELINGLSDRIKEGNILIGSLQQRLALPEPRDHKPVETIKAKNAATVKPEKTAAPSSKSAKPKRGFLSRMFR